MFFALSHLDGMLNEDRQRAHIFQKVIEDPNQNTNVLEILNTFLSTNSSNDNLKACRFMAAYIQATLIERLDDTRLEKE